MPHIFHSFNFQVYIQVSNLLLYIEDCLMQGEKECMYYMSTGSCKFSTNCRFHHPDPVVVGAQDHSSRHQNGGSTQLRTPTQLPMTSWPNKAVPYLEPPFLSGYFLPPQGLHPNPEWNGYQVMV